MTSLMYYTYVSEDDTGNGGILSLRFKALNALGTSCSSRLLTKQKNPQNTRKFSEEFYDTKFK